MLLARLLALALTQSPQSARVDSIMNAQVGPATPGAAVVVIHNGKVVHQKGYGLANIETKTPITTTTTFDLASVSKQFTAMAIMILAERGKLSYEDPLTKFFPEFPSYASKITVRHLLNHTSGLPDYMGVFSRSRPPGIGDEPSSREAVTMLTKIAEPLFAPGDKWEYSNSGYVVLGQIAEVASGMTLPAFLKANVFDPLGMTSTIISDQIKAPAVNRAISYAPAANDIFRNADYTPLNRIYGDGNVNTSVEDMVKWDQALYTDRLVKQRTLEQAFTPAKLNDGTMTTYGFGWTITDIKGLRVVEHGGSWVGFRTYIMRVPSEHFTVIALSNVANYGPADRVKRIANVYLGDKIPVRAVVAVDQRVLSTYVGKYELPSGAVLDIALNGGSLWVRPNGQPSLRLAAESETAFYVVGVEGTGLTFNRDEAGKVTSLTLHQDTDRVARRLP